MIQILSVGYDVIYEDIVSYLLSQADKHNISLLEPDTTYERKLIKKQFRWINPCAEIGLMAAKHAFDNFSVNSLQSCKNSDEWGVYAGTAYGGMLVTQKEICESIAAGGFENILPSHTIHSGYSFTAEVIATQYSISGAIYTYVDGSFSSGIALIQAIDDIAFGKVKNAVVIGNEFIDDDLRTMYRALQPECESLNSGACCLLLGEEQDESYEVEEAPKIKYIDLSYQESQAGKINCKERIRSTLNQSLNNTNLESDNIDLIIFVHNGNPNIENDFYRGYWEVFKNGKNSKQQVINLYQCFGYMIGASIAFSIGIASALLKSDLPVRKMENIMVLSVDEKGKLMNVVIGR